MCSCDPWKQSSSFCSLKKKKNNNTGQTRIVLVQSGTMNRLSLVQSGYAPVPESSSAEERMQCISLANNTGHIHDTH